MSTNTPETPKTFTYNNHYNVNQRRHPGETRVPTTNRILRGIRNLTQQIGRRGSYLLFLALLDLIYAFGLNTQTVRSSGNPTTLFLASIMPLTIWSLIWTLVALTCLTHALQPRPKDMPAFYLAMALKIFWAVVFLAGWLLGSVERGYLSTAIWGAFALITLLISGWRENNER